MAHLLFDIGNTRSKIAVMEEGIVQELLVCESLKADSIELITNRYNVDAALACITGKAPDFATLLPKELMARFHRLSYRSVFPFEIDYETPETLGMDRVAAVTGARQLASKTPLVVVDAGTCITIDFLDDQDVYRGGAILPGLTMRLRAMNEQTATLPLIVPTDEERSGRVAIPLEGRSTREAILAGVLRAAVYEIQGFIDEYARRYEDVKLFLTGGDADFFANQLIFPNFANPNLLFIGLEKLLELNIKR